MSNIIPYSSGFFLKLSEKNYDAGKKQLANKKQSRIPLTLLKLATAKEFYSVILAKKRS